MPEARIAVLGAGWRGAEVNIPALLANPEALRQITEKFGIPAGYTDYRELLAREPLDGAIIVSPHTVHFEQAMACLEAGLHVLVDKPMTTSASDARATVAKAAEVGRQIVVPSGWNFKDFTRKAADLVAAGRLGEVRHISCQMASPTGDLFSGDWLVETASHMFQPERSTWADPANPGGYGWGQRGHALGLMFAVTGLSPAQVFAMGGKSKAGVDYCDALTVRMTSGATAAISGVTHGREIHGQPKKLAEPALEFRGDLIVGSCRRNGIDILTGTMPCKQQPVAIAELDHFPFKTNINLKAVDHSDGTPAIRQLTSRALADVEVTECWRGPCKVELRPNAQAPVHRLPVREMPDGFHWRARFTLVPCAVIHDDLKGGA